MYSASLRDKLLELRELVDANLVESAEQQQRSYNGSESNIEIQVGQQVLLNNLTRGKLDPQWTGPWNVTAHKGPSTIWLKMRSTERAVHINRVRPLLTEEGADHRVLTDWSPTLFCHEGSIPTLPLVENQLGELNYESAGGNLPSPDAATDTPGSSLGFPPGTPPPLPTTTRSGRHVKPLQRYGYDDRCL